MIVRSRSDSDFESPAGAALTLKVTGDTSTVPTFKSSQGLLPVVDFYVDGLGAPRHQRLAVNLGQSLPAEPGRDASEVFAP